MSATGVNPSPRSNVNGAFASSLAESNGNGGVGVSQADPDLHEDPRIFPLNITLVGPTRAWPGTISRPGKPALRGRR